MILITFGFSRATHVMEKIVRTSINSTIDRFNRIQICTVFFFGSYFSHYSVFCGICNVVWCKITTWCGENFVTSTTILEMLCGLNFESLGSGSFSFLWLCHMIWLFVLMKFLGLRSAHQGTFQEAWSLYPQGLWCIHERLLDRFSDYGCVVQWQDWSKFNFSWFQAGVREDNAKAFLGTKWNWSWLWGI